MNCLKNSKTISAIIHFIPFVTDGRKIAKASGYNLNYLIENDLCAGKTKFQWS